MKTKISLATTSWPKMMAGRFRTFCGTRLLPLLLFLLLPAVVQAQYNYATNSDNTITITGYTGVLPSVLTLPSTITGLPVISIGDNAFNGCTSLTSVTIPNNVTSIGEEAFDACTSLTNVTMGTNVTSIGEEAFYGCTSLTSVTIPNSVISIGDAPFAGCTSLRAITVDTNNPAYSSVAGVLFDKSQSRLIQYPAGEAGSYTIPNSVTSIGNDAFGACTSLTSVTFPNSVTSIGEGAFFDCTGLTSVSMGNSVTSIGNDAFGACTSLTSVTIPNSVTSIGEEAFGWCTGLTSVTIGTNVASIGDLAFDGCTSLTSVYFTGNAPSADSTVFACDVKATVYYLPWTTGWSTPFGGIAAVLWNPQAQNLGVQANQFGFTITGPSNLVIVVEACTNLVNAVWVPVATNTLTGGSSYFSDPDWTNYPCRFYRLRSP